MAREGESGKTLKSWAEYRFLRWVSYLFLFLSLMFYVWSRYFTFQTGYQLSQAIAEEKEILKKERALSLEISNLSSPKNIESQARKKFGLMEPRPDQVIFIKKEMHAADEGGLDVEKEDKK